MIVVTVVKREVICCAVIDALQLFICCASKLIVLNEISLQNHMFYCNISIFMKSFGSIFKMFFFCVLTVDTA